MNKSTLPAFWLTLLSCALCSSVAVAATPSFTLTIDAGDVRREQSVATFPLPAAGGNWRLRDGAGREVPLQVRGKEAAFVIGELAAGAKATYRLEAGTSAKSGEGVRLERADGRIAATVGRAAVLSFQEQPATPANPKIKDVYKRGGYIHPVFSPGGIRVTDDYPADHFHHHGIWFAWVKTEYEGRHPDFWNVGDDTGRIDFQGVGEFWSGSVHGGLTAKFQSIDLKAPAPKPVVDEQWEVRVYTVGEGARRYRMFDLVSTQRILGDSPLKLPVYRYGGVGIRGHEQWIGKGDKTKFLTSTGERDRIKAHESRAAWCHMGGLVDGKPTGIATLAHPANFRSPEPMRVNPNIPFLNFAPSQAGDWEMVPGKTYVWRYRFIVQDGEPDQAWLESRWQDYAKPVAVTISPTAR